MGEGANLEEVRDRAGKSAAVVGHRGVIRLFISDLDGCISHAFRAPPLDVLAELVDLHSQHERDPAIPTFTICTGRPLAYAEAVAQWLAVTVPILFESGSGMYDPVTNQIGWSTAIAPATDRALDELRQVIHRDVVPGHPGTTAEFAKRKDVGVINPDPARIAELIPVFERHLARYPDADLELHHTAISVNIVPRAANKGAGLEWLAGRLGVSLDETAYMGDSMGDLSALTRVARPFAPSNATPEVKAVAAVTRGDASHGLLEAFRAVIADNRASP